MLNFAEQTGSSAVMIVWSFLLSQPLLNDTYSHTANILSMCVFRSTRLHKFSFAHKVELQLAFFFNFMYTIVFFVTTIFFIVQMFVQGFILACSLSHKLTHSIC